MTDLALAKTSRIHSRGWYFPLVHRPRGLLGAVARIVAALIVVALAASSLPASAHAQGRDVDDAERDEARALFVAGSAAVDGGRWADAVASFERAYALTDAPSALYNLAIALRALGRHREARDAFARLLERHTIDEDLRATATQMRHGEAARVAVLELVGLDEDAPHAVRFDGRDVAGADEARRARRPIVIETDAGAHTLVAERDGFQPFVWEGTLDDGQRRSVRAVFQQLGRGDDTALHVVLVAAAVAAVVVGGAVLGWYVHEEAQVRPLFPMQVEP